MAKTIESEILDVYDAPRRKRSEDDQTYYARLVQTSVAGTDAQWDRLESPAQEWINAGVLAKKQGRDYDPFPDAEPPEAVVEEQVVAKEPEDRWRARPVKAKAAAAPEPAPAPAPAPTLAPVARRRRGRPPALAPVPAPVRAAPPPAAKVASRRGNGRRLSGVYAQTQEYVVRHPNATTKDIIAALENKGLDPKQQTVQSVRGHTRDTIKVMQRVHKEDFGLTID